MGIGLTESRGGGNKKRGRRLVGKRKKSRKIKKSQKKKTREKRARAHKKAKTNMETASQIPDQTTLGVSGSPRTP